MEWGLKIALPLLLSLQLPLGAFPTYAESDVTTLVRDNTSFACDLYQSLRSTEGNIFISPYSISTVLSLTCAGAGGNTEAQMKSTLRFSLDKDRLPRAFSELRETDDIILKNGNVGLAVANSLWPQREYKLLDTFLTFARKYYGVTVTPVDYIRETENSRQRINKWVEDATWNKIMDIIQPGVLDASTQLVLVNAIYFKGNWLNPFPTDQIQDEPFFLTPGKSIRAPMMSQKKWFRYVEIDSVQVLELSYRGNEISMVVLLPVGKDGLASLEGRLSVENLKRWETLQKEREVLVFLPRFRITSQFSLNTALQSMGMEDAFSAAKADFLGMTGNPGLFISAVVHKAFVDVNENGTEAAASTAIAFPTGRGMPEPPPVFRADHPFLIVIRENATGSILFMGRVADPTKS